MIIAIIWSILAYYDGCRHLYYLTPGERVRAIRIIWILQPFVITSLGTGKVSVAFLILRLMGKSFWRRRLLYGVMISCFVVCSAAIIITYVQCRPVAALWNPEVKANCWDANTQTSVNIFTGSTLIAPYTFWQSVA